jgi:cation diffusion facilitator CzcD-associated flavoprotein CzcO
MQRDVDVLVIGAGACGLAAIAAFDAGVSEKMSRAM